MKSRQRALLSKVIPEFAERGVWILFNISCQLFQLLWSENGTPVSSRQRSELSLAACANPSANSFDVIAKNIRKLLPAGATRQIRLCNNRTDFRICYFHAESLANFYNLSMLNCSSLIEKEKAMEYERVRVLLRVGDYVLEGEDYIPLPGPRPQDEMTWQDDVVGKSRKGSRKTQADPYWTTVRVVARKQR